uniref:Uncharacterized protein n=1 Tax=Peronospora matthiolae TaxID=2874970 RepID=A0AAV1T1F4_9STRA
MARGMALWPCWFSNKQRTVLESERCMHKMSTKHITIECTPQRITFDHDNGVNHNAGSFDVAIQDRPFLCKFSGESE